MLYHLSVLVVITLSHYTLVQTIVGYRLLVGAS